MHDLRSAALAGDGTRSTGHATQPGGSPYGPSPTNLVLAGGDAAGIDELIAPIERGIYVTRLWYVNTVRDKETLLTGMTREGTFLIEDGVIARPLKDVRFTDSVLRLLSATQALTTRAPARQRGRVLRPPLRPRRRLPRAARRRLSHHRRDAVAALNDRARRMHRGIQRAASPSRASAASA